jgi:hypothetical protein
MNSPIVLENGDTIQGCNIITKIDGISLQGKTVCDYVDFIVPNAIMVGSPTPTVAGWEYIKNTLAPQWVIDNYQAI